MPDTELRARITAQDQASAVIRNVGKAAEGLAGSLKQTQQSTLTLGQRLQQTGTQMITWGKNTQWLGRQLMYNVSIPILGVATAATKMAFDFDKSMAQVRAAASSTAVVSIEQYSKMKEAVLEVSRASIQSAGDISKAFYELVSAGYSVEDSMNMLAKVAQFATASSLDMATAAQFASAQLHAWTGTGITLSEIMDKTAVAVQATQLHFEDFVHSAELAGSMGRTAGQSFDEMSAALMAMADRGVVAGRMGFYLRAIFQTLGSQSDKAKNIMEELGLSFADVAGNIKPLSIIAKEFGEKLSGVSSQQERLSILTAVFNRNAATGFIPIMEAATQNTGLFSDETEKLAQSMVEGEGSAADFSGEIKNTARSLDEYLDLVRQSEGATKRMADAVNSTDYAKMQIAINNLKAAGIEIGERLMPIITRFVDRAIIPLVNWFAKLSPKIQNIILGAAGLLAVLGPLMIVVASGAQVIGLFVNGLGNVIRFMETFRIISLAAGGGLDGFVAGLKNTNIGFLVFKIFDLTKIVALWIANHARMLSTTIANSARIKAAWIADSAKMYATWISNHAKMLITTISNSAQIVLQNLKTTTQVVGAWITSHAKIVASSLMTATKMAAHGIEAGATWIAHASKVSAAWIANFVAIRAKAFWAGVETGSPSVVAAEKWIKKAVETSIAWATNFAKMVANAIQTGIKIAVQAWEISSKWIIESYKIVTTWIANNAKIVWSSLTTKYKLIIDALETAVVWIAQPFKIAIAWITKYAQIIIASATAKYKMVIDALEVGIAWIKKAAESSIAWISKFALMVVASAVTKYKMIIDAFEAGSAWIAQAGRALIGWVAGFFTPAAAGSLGLAVGMEIEASRAGIAWAGAAAKAALAWLATLGPFALVAAAIAVIVGVVYKIEQSQWSERLKTGAEMALGPIAMLAGLIMDFNSKMDFLTGKTNAAKQAMEGLKTAEDALKDSQMTLNQANLTLATSHQQVSFWTGEVTRLEQEGKTNTDEYKVATAQLAVAHDDVTKAEGGVIEANTNMNKALSDKKAAQENINRINEQKTALQRFADLWNSIQSKVIDLVVRTKEIKTFGSKEEAEAYWGSLQTGGIIPTTGMYMMHKGERVTPEGSHTQSGESIVVNAYFYGDINESGADLGMIGRKLARSIELAKVGISG